MAAPSPLSVVAAVLLVTGGGLMIASLGIERARSADPAAAPARAVAVSTPSSPLENDPSAVAVYRLAQTAAWSTGYDGVKRVTRVDGTATRTTVVKVSHQPGLGVVVEADGADGRREGEMFTRTSRGDADADESALRALLRGYRLRTGGDAMVAGRAADVVAVHRVDGTVAARIWIDESTGLVLRRESVDHSGAVVEASAFVEITVGRPDLRHLPPVAPSPWAEVPAEQVRRLRAESWPLPEELGGGFVLAEVRHDDAADGLVVQLAYTDGLTDVSVFLQRGSLDSGALGDAYVRADVDGGLVWVRQGGVPLAVWQSGDVVVTATSDTVAAPLAEVVSVLPAEPGPEDGVRARVGRGLQRVGSWFNPLG